jgi:hypothetical protein
MDQVFIGIPAARHHCFMNKSMKKYKKKKKKLKHFYLRIKSKDLIKHSKFLSNFLLAKSRVCKLLFLSNRCVNFNAPSLYLQYLVIYFNGTLSAVINVCLR